MEIYRPLENGTFPLILLLHNSAGAFTLKSAAEPATENFGEKTLARSCFVVVLPHYLEAMGRKSLMSREEITARFPELVAIAGTLLDRAEALPWVKGRPVFVFGESLGGYLGVVLAFRRGEIAAVSEVSGGMAEGYGIERPNRPRVLVSHGLADELVPAQEADALAHYCSEHGISFEGELYPGEGHYLSGSARSLVVARTIEFFRRQEGARGPKPEDVKPRAR